MIKAKNNVATMLLVCVCLFLLTGCGNQIPEMTEEQNALITEYATGLLLKYHADYDGRLVDTSVPPEISPEGEAPEEEIVTDNPEVEESITSDSTVSSNTTEETVRPELSIAQVLDMDGFDISYRTFEVCNNYPNTESSPEDLFFSMKAGQGNKLLVLKLEIMNTAPQENMCDTLSMTDLDCEIIINGNDTQRAYVSMLENDFMAVSRSFAIGESYEAVIITEMTEEEAQGIASVKLKLQHERREALVSATE